MFISRRVAKEWRTWLGPDLQSAAGCRTIPRAAGPASRIAAVRAHGVGRLRNSAQDGAGTPGLFYPDRAWIARVDGVPLARVRFFDPGILFFDLQVTYLDPQVTFLDLQVTFLDPQVTFLDLQVTYLDLQVAFLDPQVAFLDLQVTYLDPQVTYLDLQVALLDLQVALLDLQVTFLDPQVAFPDPRIPVFDPRVIFSDTGDEVPRAWISKGPGVFLNSWSGGTRCHMLG
jgi:hypothetical protein